MIDSNLFVGIVGIGATGIVALLIFLLDKKRRDNIEKTHKKIIASDMHELNEIVTHIILDVNDLETDEEAVSNHLNKFLIRNYSHIEFLMNNIKLHHTQCNKLSNDEELSIKKTIDTIKWILEKYCPQDVPEHRRANLWKEPSIELKANAQTLVKAVSAFTNS
ncbi:MAG: hypothetical protein IIC67_10110 [Thaumarchaeota archaeon]|nr:hypothetical protein [Nitrososphaerota archaeon]